MPADMQSAHLRRAETLEDFQNAFQLVMGLAEMDVELGAQLGIDADEILRLYYEPTPERLRQRFTGPRRRMLLLETPTGIIGCAGLVADNPVATMHNVFLLPESRGAGHGRRLVEAIIEAAREEGCTELMLATAVFLHDAIALYRRMGFTDCAPFGGESPTLVANNVYLSRAI